MVNKYSVKIPKDISLIYLPQKKLLIFKKNANTKFIKLKVKLEIFKNENVITVTTNPYKKTSSLRAKNLKALRGTTLSQIKQSILELSYTFYKKLQLVGVGFRVVNVDNFETELLMFKLGYSHPLYIKIPKNLEISSFKLTKLFISGNSYQDITQAASLIRHHKKPEPYKGKGILYENEKIVLKEGKKV